MIDRPIFYSRSPDMLKDAQDLQNDHIDEFAIKGVLEAENLRIYREKRSRLLKKALEDGIKATIAGDYVRGNCAAEKEAYLKALNEKQVARYRIQHQQTRMDNIRHINKSIEHEIRGG